MRTWAPSAHCPNKASGALRGLRLWPSSRAHAPCTRGTGRRRYAESSRRHHSNGVLAALDNGFSIVCRCNVDGQARCAQSRVTKVPSKTVASVPMAKTSASRHPGCVEILINSWRRGTLYLSLGPVARRCSAYGTVQFDRQKATGDQGMVVEDGHGKFVVDAPVTTCTCGRRLRATHVIICTYRSLAHYCCNGSMGVLGARGPRFGVQACGLDSCRMPALPFLPKVCLLVVPCAGGRQRVGVLD